MKKILLGSCALISLLTFNAGAAVVYWDNNGTSAPTSGNWDTSSSFWATSSTLVASPGKWVNNDAAVFTAGSASNASITMTVTTANILCGGVFDNGITSSRVGTLTINSSGSGSLSLSAAQSAFNSSVGCAIVVNGVLTGTGGPQQQGSGTLSLFGNNTFTGATSITGGQTLFYNNNSSFSTGPIIVNGSTGAIVNSAAAALTLPNPIIIPTINYNVNLAGGNPVGGLPGTTFTGPVSLPSSGTTVIYDSSTATEVIEFSGAIGGGSALTLSDNGTTILAGANTYTGATTISSPNTVQLANLSALGSSVATVASGGVVDLDGTPNINAALILNGTGISSGGAMINSSAANASTLNGGVVAATKVTAAGTGISTPVTVTVSGGGGSGAAASANLGLTAASFTVSAGTQKYTAVPAITISGGGGSNATATCALAGTSPSVISTTITITDPGEGYASAPTIAFSGGTLSGSGTAPSGTGNATHFTLDGVILTSPGSGYTTAPTLAFSSGTSTATAVLSSVSLASASSLGGAGNTAINSIVSGTGNLTKVGAGTVTLNGANTYTGTTIASAGTLALGTGGSINTSPSLTIKGGAAFDVTGADPYTLSASTTLNASGTGASPAALSDSAVSGSINLGSQPIVLTYTPSGSSGDLSDPALSVPSGALTLSGNQITVNNAGPAMGAGIYTLINVAGGTITGSPALSVAVTGAGLAPGCVADIQVSSGSVNLIVTASVNSPVWNGNDFANSPDWSDATNWAGLASPGGGDAVTFDGTTGLTPVMDSNNILASVTFNPGAGAFTLTNTNSAILAVTDGVTNNSPNLQTIDLPVALNNQTVQVAVASGPIQVDGIVSDNGLGMAVSGPSTLTLTGVNTYSGPTTIGSGTTVTLGGAGQLHGGLYASAIGNGGTLNYNSTAPQSLSGVISGGGALNANGGGLTLSAVNTYTGPTSIGSGSLTISAGSLGSGTYANTISDASSFVYNSTASQTLSGIISGIGTLTQGAGTLTLSGANTYSGNTIINAGTLKIGATGDLGDLGGSVGSYAGNITDNGAFSYGGTATQTLSGNITGTGSVAVTAGNMTLSGANSYGGTTSLTGGTLNVSSISDTGTANMPSNSFTFGGTSTFNYTGSAPVTTGRLFTGNSAAATTFNFTGNVTLTNRLTGGAAFTVIYNGPGTLTLANELDDSFFGMTINAPVILATAGGSIHGLGTASSIGSSGSLKLAGFGGADIYSGVNITNILGGLLDLAGQNDSFSALFLGSVGTNASLINSIAGTTATLTNASSNVVLVANTVIGGAGNIAFASGVYGGATSSTLTYSGTGSLILETTNYTKGAITVGSGSLLLGKVGTTNGALVSATATVEAQSGATFGCAATTGICGVAGATTFDPGASALFTAVGGNTTTNGKLFITNNLTLNSTPVTINVTGSALAAGTYVLMTNTGTLTGSAATGSPTITGTPLASGSTAAISMNGNSVVLTVTAATPVFSGLTAKTITYGNGGSSTVTLTGTISASGIFPANGDTGVSATIGSGAVVNGAVNNTSGAFSITYNDPTIKTDSVVGGPTYPITYNYAGNGTSLNAAVPDSSTTLTVNPLTAQLGGTELYSGTTSATNLTVTNAINGDTVTASGSATMAAAGVPTESLTSFAGVTLGGAQGGNYTLTASTGSVSVTPAPLIITALPQSVPYGTAVPATTVGYNTFVGSDSVSSLTTPPTVASALSGVLAVGSYPGNYTASGAVDPNYSISYLPGNLTVVNPFNPFSITSAALDATGTNLVVCWSSVPGVSYNILTNGNLATTNWVDVGAPFSPTGPVPTNTYCVTLPGATNTNVFVLIKQN